MARFGSEEIGDPYTIKWLRPVMVTAVASEPFGTVPALTESRPGLSVGNAASRSR